MKKAKYHNNKKGMLGIHLDYYLFKDDAAELKKTFEILKLFSPDDLSVKCEFFVDEKDYFLDEVELALKCKADILFTRKKLLSKKTYSKVSVKFNGSLLYVVLELAIKHVNTLEAKCFDIDNHILIEFVINDNDGSCIHFNTEKYNEEIVKRKITQILND